MANLEALVHVTQRGYYPLCIMNFETKEVTVYTQNGRETISFDNITSINLSVDIPFLIMPN